MGEVAKGSITLDAWKGSVTTDVGWGVVHVCTRDSDCQKSLLASTANNPLRAPWAETVTAQQRDADVPADRLLPNVGHPPVTVFVVMILLFALAIGPGSL